MNEKPLLYAFLGGRMGGIRNPAALLIHIGSTFHSPFYPPGMRPWTTMDMFYMRGHESPMIWTGICTDTNKVFAVRNLYSMDVPIACPHCHDSQIRAAWNTHITNYYLCRTIRIEEEVMHALDCAEILLGETIPRLDIALMPAKDAVECLTENEISITKYASASHFKYSIGKDKA